MIYCVILCVFLTANLVQSTPSAKLAESNAVVFAKKDFEEAFLKKLNARCSQRDNSACVMLKLITYMNRMLKKSTISLTDSLELVQIKNEFVNNTQEDDSLLARAQGSDDATLSILLAEKMWSFFRSRSLKWKVLSLANFIVSSDDDGKLNLGLLINTKKALEAGRGKIKNSGHIIGAIAAKTVLIGALIFKGLVLLVGKALLVSKLAFILASIIAIKKLLSKKHVTYEVVAHPVHDHHHHETISSGWGRAIDGFVEGVLSNVSKNMPADDLAYSSYNS